VLALAPSILPLVAVLAVLALGIVVALYRPLLLASLSADLAAARGLPVRLIGALYLTAMALAVALSAVTIGAILSTALLVGPAAIALQLTNRPLRATLVTTTTPASPRSASRSTVRCRPASPARATYPPSAPSPPAQVPPTHPPPPQRGA